MSKKKSKPSNAGPKSKVLDGYKRVGSKFIPPMNQLGPMKNVSYQRLNLPELIWWDVIADQTTQSFAVTLSEALGVYFKDKDIKQKWWAYASDYASLNDAEFESLKDYLRNHGLLPVVQSALRDFLDLYPNCPLSRFLDRTPEGAVDIKYLQYFEKRLELLEDKRSREGVLMQANMIYLGFILDKLKIRKGMSLGNLHELENYPETEESKAVGASICATINMLGMQLTEVFEKNTWVQYFWSRSYELRPIQFNFEEKV